MQKLCGGRKLFWSWLLSEFVVDSTFTQLDANLQMVELLQESGVEVPTELSQTMFNIAHSAGMRCKYDSCSRELEHKDS
jgi:hypothetical protein